MKLKEFIMSKQAKFIAGSAPVAAALASIGSFAASAPSYTVKSVPSAQDMDLSAVGNVWNYAQSMLQDTLAIVSNYPILVILLIALPLVGIGIGIFKRLINA